MENSKDSSFSRSFSIKTSTGKGRAMVMANIINVRKVKLRELTRIAKMEQEIWTKEGADVFSIEHIESWYEMNPEGFIVATVKNEVVGYAYAQIMMIDPATLELPSTYMQTIDNGFCHATHQPNGNFHFCITVCSTCAGGGRALTDALRYHASKLKKPLLGVSRVIGLADYLRQIREVNSRAKITKRDEFFIAWHYATKSAIMVNGQISSTDISKPRAQIQLPNIPAADHVLAKYMRNSFTLVRPLAEYLKDPKSANFGMLCLQAKNNQ